MLNIAPNNSSENEIMNDFYKSFSKIFLSNSLKEKENYQSKSMNDSVEKNKFNTISEEVSINSDNLIRLHKIEEKVEPIEETPFESIQKDLKKNREGYSKSDIQAQMEKKTRIISAKLLKSNLETKFQNESNINSNLENLEEDHMNMNSQSFILTKNDTLTGASHKRRRRNTKGISLLNDRMELTRTDVLFVKNEISNIV